MAARTDLLLDLKTRGFDQGIQKTARLGKESKRAMEEAKKEVERLDTNLKKLAQSQVKLNRAMEGVEKGSDAYKKVGRELKMVQQETQRTERVVQSLNRAFTETAKKGKSGAFTQGLMQGATGVDFFQRGQPGQMRQAAGIGAGRAARGMAGGVASSPFTGSGGLIQAVQSIPGVGGLLAAPMQAALQQASQAMSFKQARQEQMPFLSMGTQMGSSQMVGEGPGGQRRRAMAEASRIMSARGAKGSGGGALTGSSAIGASPSVGSALADLVSSAFGGGVKGRLARGQRDRDIQAAGGPAAYAEQQRAQEQQKIADGIISKEGVSSRRRQRRTLGGEIQRQGQRFGYAAPEALQMAGAVSKAGGGSGGEIASQNMLPQIFAAQRMGMGSDVAGSFLQGGRRGGVVGGSGRGGDAMQEAIRGGMRMGLEGSELTEFMSQMAGDIRGWRTSGIPINPGSLTKLGKGIGGMGVGGLRGGVMAQGLQSAARGLSERGPQSAAEFAMLQEFGGFKGGGAEAVEEAQLKLQEGTFTPEDTERIFKRMLGAGGGGAAGRTTFRSSMKGLGINVTIRESRLMEKKLTTGLSESEQVELDRERDRGEKAAAGYTPKGVRGMVDGNLKRQAAITNQQIETGMTMITSMQNMEQSTTRIAHVFSNVAAPALTEFTGSISGLSKVLDQMTGKNWSEPPTSGGGSQ